MNTSLSTVSRILLIQHAAAVKILKLHLITFFIVQNICMKERPSCTVLNIFDFNHDKLTEIVLRGKEDLDNINNTTILCGTIKHLIESKTINIEIF